MWTVRADFDTSDANGPETLTFDAVKKSFTLSHVYAAPGTYQVMVEILDGTGMTAHFLTVDVLTNQAPTIASEIPNATVLQGFQFQNSYVDLRNVFVDSDGPQTELQYSIFSNSNTGLITPAIGSGKLNLALNPAASGTATITVRATDAAGNSVDDTFVIQVLSPDVTKPTSCVALLPSQAVSLDIPVTVVGDDVLGSLDSQLS